MRKAILPIMLTFFSVNALGAKVGDLEIGNMLHYWDLVFQLIQKIIVTDVSRIIITYILLFIVFAKTMQVAIKKTPLGENAGIISNALAAIATISLFFKTRNFLDKFSWIIMFVGLAVIGWMVYDRFFGRFFTRSAKGYDYVKKNENHDKKYEKKENREEKHIRNDEGDEGDDQKDELDNLNERKEIAKKLEHVYNQLKNPSIPDESFYNFINGGHINPLIEKFAGKIIKDEKLLKDEHKIVSDELKDIDDDLGFIQIQKKYLLRDYKEYNREITEDTQAHDRKARRWDNHSKGLLKDYFKDIYYQSKMCEELKVLTIQQKELIENSLDHLGKAKNYLDHLPTLRGNRADYNNQLGSIIETIKRLDGLESQELHRKHEILIRKLQLSDALKKLKKDKKHLDKKLSRDLSHQEHWEAHIEELKKKAESI